MDTETEDQSPQQEYTNDVQADLEAAIKELEERPEVERDEAGKFKAKEEVQAKEPEQEVEPAPEPAKEVAPAPQSWGASVKGKWAELPEEVRAEIQKRETDIHQMLTRHDGELRLGREMKEVVTPYLATIQAEGGTPTSAVASLLNTAHILRTGTPEAKKSLILNTAKQFGVDLGLGEEEYVDPTIAQLKQQIDELRQLANPQVIEKNLTERMEAGKIQQDIAAFASDPAHVHFEAVKPLMASILGAGQAKDLKEAYDMACMANPQIRSTLLSAQTAEHEAKRKQEIANKKRAASSVTGSPAIPSNSKVNNPKSSVEDDLRAAFSAFEEI